jgi:endonuclease III
MSIRSSDLGIDLRTRRESALFKWLLACLLFGKPIQQEVAARAYHELVKAGLTTPQKILQAGWQKLVQILDRGHYVRFDESTATKLLQVCEALLARYGTMRKLLYECENPAELARRLQEFKGIGPTTARIFVRDVKPVW